MKRLELIAPGQIPEIVEGDDLPQIIADAFRGEHVDFQDGDILIVTHKIVSKMEGRVYDLREIVPSDAALTLASRCGKPASLVELILRESKCVMKVRQGVLIMRHRLGLICANAGVDQSNSGGESQAVLLPECPDQSAKAIHDGIKRLTKRSVPVLISDSQGRPFRNGTLGIAIGCYGLEPMRDYRGRHDRQGHILQSSVEALADELCCAASLLMGQSNESLPVVLIRGAEYLRAHTSASRLLRSEEQDLFLN
ncbi:MAG: coenzyme F420-0:L-glutamate ligase [Lawsonibacter sp.]|nr:coenzyme F420-0:L-glutamate ligase [Lawsonibacter sp.]MCI9656098.1 coenzyme F420-0:L-glutamate ligase [Lawsonibacter sp.]